MAYISRLTLDCAASPEAMPPMTTPAPSSEANRSPPILVAMSKAAEDSSAKVPPGCTSWVT